MRMSARARVSALAILTSLLASCGPPQSRNPLSDPKTAVADARLKGLWAGKTGDSDATVQFFAKPGALVDLVIVGDDGDKGAGVLVFEGFPSQIGGKSYLNLRAKKFKGDYAESSELSASYIFAKYEISKDGSLRLWNMDDELVEAAVKAGKLEGTVTDGDVALTASSEKLAEFVKAADPTKLFVEVGAFRRVPAARKP